MKQSSIFKTQKSMYSQILCYVSAKFFNILNATKLGRTELQEYEPREATDIMMLPTESRRNSSGIFSQDSIRCSSATRSKVYCTDWEKHQKISQEEFYSCRCSTTFPVEQKTMNKNVWHTLESYLRMQGGLVQDNGHSLVLVLKRSGTL